jgi:hypothetical protein
VGGPRGRRPGGKDLAASARAPAAAPRPHASAPRQRRHGRRGRPARRRAMPTHPWARRRALCRGWGRRPRRREIRGTRPRWEQPSPGLRAAALRPGAPRGNGAPPPSCGSPASRPRAGARDQRCVKGAPRVGVAERDLGRAGGAATGPYGARGRVWRRAGGRARAPRGRARFGRARLGRARPAPAPLPRALPRPVQARPLAAPARHLAGAGYSDAAAASGGGAPTQGGSNARSNAPTRLARPRRRGRDQPPLPLPPPPPPAANRASAAATPGRAGSSACCAISPANASQRPWRASSARASPTAGESLNPWPLQAEHSTTCRRGRGRAGGRRGWAGVGGRGAEGSAERRPPPPPRPPGPGPRGV